MDRAYQLLSNVRGSPPYWQKLFYKVLAMIRQLGIPTWFITFSAAEMRRPEVIQAIAAQYGTIYTDQEVKELSLEQRSRWLRTNPDTAARQFQYRLETCLHKFLKSSANPIGEVDDYVLRDVFQIRGSPHSHGLVFCKRAPRLGVNTTEEVI